MEPLCLSPLDELWATFGDTALANFSSFLARKGYAISPISASDRATDEIKAANVADIAAYSADAAAVGSAPRSSHSAPSAPVEPPRKRNRAEMEAKAGEGSCAALSAPMTGTARKAASADKRAGPGGFDFSRFRFRHVALHFLYLGHKYHGFAAQLVSGGYGNGGGEKPRVREARKSTAALGGTADAAAAAAAAADAATASASVSSTLGPSAAAASSAPVAPPVEQHSVETVESALFQALTRACLIESRGTCGYTRCGRTDAGVSAAGQVVALRLRSKARLLAPPATAAGSGSSGVSARDGRDATTAGAGAGAGAGDETYTTPVWYRHDGRANDGPGAEAFPPPEGENDYAAMLNGVLPDDIRIIGWADLEEPEGTATVDVHASEGRIAAPAAPAAISAAADGGASASDSAASAAAPAASPLALPLALPLSTLPSSPPFSARFSCTRRVYRYFWVNRGYDVAAMRNAAARLCGTHDFRNFAKYAVVNTQNFVRRVEAVRVIVVGSAADAAGAYTPAASTSGSTSRSSGIASSASGRGAIAAAVLADAAADMSSPASAGTGAGAKLSAADVGASSGAGSGADVGADDATAALPTGDGDSVPVGSLCFFEVVGQAFLWHQVRCMASVLFHVGAGLEAPSVVDFLLDVHGACPSRPQYDLAPELPLCLHHCGYGEEQELERSAADASALAAAEAEEKAADAAAAAAAAAFASTASAAMAVDAAALPGAAGPGAAAATAAAVSSSVAAAGASVSAVAAVAAVGDDDGEGGARPSWAAPSLPSLYRRMKASANGLASANAALYSRWERMQVECAMLGSMLSRLRTFAVSAGLQPWQASPRDAVCRARKYIPFATRPREPTLAEKWGKLTAEERRRVAAMHPHNTARLLGSLAHSER